MCHIQLDFVPVHQEIEGQEKDDDEIYHLVEQGKGYQQGRLDCLGAEGCKLCPCFVHAFLEKSRFCQPVQLLDIGCQSWQLLRKSVQGRDKAAGHNGYQSQKDDQEANQHQQGSQPPGHLEAELVHRVQKEQRQQYGQEEDKGECLHVPEGQQQGSDGCADNYRGFVVFPHGHHLQYKTRNGAAIDGAAPGVRNTGKQVLNKACFPGK